jgi:hypothetical protein
MLPLSLFPAKERGKDKEEANFSHGVEIRGIGPSAIHFNTLLGNFLLAKMAVWIQKCDRSECIDAVYVALTRTDHAKASPRLCRIASFSVRDKEG